MILIYAFEFQNTVKYVFCRGALNRVGEQAAMLGKKALIVTYGSKTLADVVARIREDLARHQVECVLFNRVPPNPLNSTVDSGAKLAREEACDIVIGLGGGSAMDTAKGIAFMSGKEGDIFDYIFGKRSGNSALPVIAITTTSGTGSEGNGTAVFTHEETKDKKGIVSPLLFPKVAILDPELMTSLPKKHIAGPGVDALFHAFESFISVKCNPLSEMYSRQAMRLSIEFLPKVYENSTDLDSWDKVVLANTLGGIAIGSAACTLPHALGQPVSGLLDSSHSDTLVGVYIPFMRYTAPYAKEKFAYIAELLGCDTASMSVDEAAKKSPEYMRAFLEKLSLDKTLGDLGVNESNIEWLADNAVTKMGPVLANNPIVPDLEMVKELYRQSL